MKPWKRWIIIRHVRYLYHYAFCNCLHARMARAGAKDWIAQHAFYLECILEGRC